MSREKKIVELLRQQNIQELKEILSDIKYNHLILGYGYGYLSLDNPLGIAEVKALAVFLAEDNNIIHVDLGGNGIKSEGAQALSSAFITNNNIIYLCLKNNLIGHVNNNNHIMNNDIDGISSFINISEPDRVDYMDLAGLNQQHYNE